MGEDRGLNNSFSGVHTGYDYDAAPRFLRRIFLTISWDAYSELRDPRANTNAYIAVAQSAVSRGGFLGGALAMRIGRSGHRHRLLVSATCAQSKGATFALTNKKNRGVRPTNGGSDNVNERNTLNSPDGMDLKLL